MATNQFTGLLQQFGLPAISEEEILAARTQERLEGVKVAAQNARGNGARIESDFRYLGRLVGGALGIKLNPSKLTPDEIKSHQAVAEAQAKYESEVAARPEIAGDPVQAELVYQKKLAEALIKTGQYDKAIPMIAQAEQKRRAYEKQKLELDRLGIAIDNETLTGDINRFNYASAQRGEFTTVYPKNSWNPNSGVDMFIDPETGDAVTYDTDGEVLARMPAGTFTTARPDVPSSGKGGGDRTLQQLGVSPTELKELRQGVQAAREQMHGAMKLYDILVESNKDGSPGINIMGAQGKLTIGFTRIVDTLQGVARQIGGTIILKDGTAAGKSLDSESSAIKYYRDNKADIERELAQLVPQNIREDETLAERYYAAIIRLTNARMKAVEPGARQLSDDDFKRALAETAGATQNPEAFRAIMLGNVLSDARNAKDRIDWLPPTIDRNRVINPSEYQEFMGELGQFETTFNSNFGTNSNPGPGLTDGTIAAPGDYSDLDNYYGTPKEE